MKILVSLAFVLLASSCALFPTSQPFVYNSQCPHTCWLGINPGVTNADEARRLLTASGQISRSSYIEDVGGFRLDWYWKQSKHPTRVGIEVEDGTASRLSFGFPASILRLQDVANLFGEPDELSIRRIEAADAIYLEYILYYTSAKDIVFATTTNRSGPSAGDSVDILYLNMDPDGTNVPGWLLRHRDLRQPWLGFGHLEDYLSNRPSP